MEIIWAGWYILGLISGVFVVIWGGKYKNGSNDAETVGEGELHDDNNSNIHSIGTTDGCDSSMGDIHGEVDHRFYMAGRIMPEFARTAISGVLRSKILSPVERDAIEFARDCMNEKYPVDEDEEI